MTGRTLMHLKFHIEGIIFVYLTFQNEKQIDTFSFN